MKKIVVILSGGMDSATLLFYAYNQVGKNVQNLEALSFDYGQRHKKEIISATKLAGLLKIKHRIVKLPIGALLNSALTDKKQDVPEGHYAAENMAQTVVPNRNMIMLSQAYAYAASIGFNEVYFGAHSGDHFIYPDCRPEFVKALNFALSVANEGYSKVRIVAPFMKMQKGDIIKQGLRFRVPYQFTWSCYKGLSRPCLRCGTCIERMQAFLVNKIKDPALSDEEWERARRHFEKIST